jgi:hypothetical protein
MIFNVPFINHNITEFDSLVFFRQNGGEQAIVQFDNYYSASIVRNDYSYGGRDGLYEIAVIGKNGEITYGTSITSDVLGYLNKQQVTQTLIKISQL